MRDNELKASDVFICLSRTTHHSHLCLSVSTEVVPWEVYVKAILLLSSTYSLIDIHGELLVNEVRLQLKQFSLAGMYKCKFSWVRFPDLQKVRSGRDCKTFIFSGLVNCVVLLNGMLCEGPPSDLQDTSRESFCLLAVLNHR